MNNDKKITQLLNRAGLWETRSQQASCKGDFNRAGRLRTKALKLQCEAKELEKRGNRNGSNN